MGLIADDLDIAQQFLGDAATSRADGLLWARAELLEAYSDGYRAMLTQSQAVRRWVVLDVPPRHTMTGRYAWESRYVAGGTFLQHTFAGEGGWAADHLWELEVLEGSASSASSGGGVTQPWERQFVATTNTPFRFALPRDAERIAGMWYDHGRLLPVSVRQLDDSQRDWMSLGGEPIAWTEGTGRTRTFELFEIVIENRQGYLRSGPRWGLPRRFSGARTYTPGGTTFYGIPRRIMSPHRQYLATLGTWGIPRRYASSAGNLLILEVVGPEVPDLGEDDEAALLPRQMRKYLVYFTLAQAWGRQGEGQRPDLAALCQTLFQHGVQVLKSLAWITRKDEQQSRGPAYAQLRYRPTVQLPSNYPRTYP